MRVGIGIRVFRSDKVVFLFRSGPLNPKYLNSTRYLKLFYLSSGQLSLGQLSLGQFPSRLGWFGSIIQIHTKIHVIFGYVAGPSWFGYLRPKRLKVTGNPKKYPKPKNVKSQNKYPMIFKYQKIPEIITGNLRNQKKYP